jgi:Bacterial Ig-like domain (group 3)
VPPPSPDPDGIAADAYAQGVFVVVTTPAGTSDLNCVAIDEGCVGTYYYQSPSTTLPSFNTTFPAPNTPFNTTWSLSVGATVAQSGGCPGSAGATGISINGSAAITGGPISLSGAFEDSTNLAVLSSIEAPITVTVATPVNITFSLSGQLTGCAAIPIPDLSLPDDLGGLFVVVSGTLTGSFSLTVTLNQGTWVLDAGLVPNQLKGAAIPAADQNCVDTTGAAAPCIETTTSLSVAGTLEVSPLWFGFNLTAGKFGFQVGVGLTVAATVSYSTGGGFDYDICAGGQDIAVGSLGPLSFSDSGVFFGPFNIYGDGTMCPLGGIGAALPATTTTVTSSENPSAVGDSVTYTASVAGSDGGGTVSFGDNGAVVSSCESVAPNASGQFTCTVPYGAGDVGTHTIVATYSGDPAGAGSISAVLDQVVSGPTVTPTSTTTTVTSSANPATVGDSVTYTATVAGSDGGGTVAFTDGGTTIAGCGAEALVAGVATCITTVTTSGTDTIVATYSGDPASTGSASTELEQVVNPSSVTPPTPPTPPAKPPCPPNPPCPPRPTSPPTHSAPPSHSNKGRGGCGRDGNGCPSPSPHHCGHGGSHSE